MSQTIITWKQTFLLYWGVKCFGALTLILGKSQSKCLRCVALILIRISLPKPLHVMVISCSLLSVPQPFNFFHFRNNLWYRPKDNKLITNYNLIRFLLKAGARRRSIDMSSRQRNLETKQGKLQFFWSSCKMWIFVQEEKKEVDRDVSIYRHFFSTFFLYFRTFSRTNQQKERFCH